MKTDVTVKQICHCLELLLCESQLKTRICKPIAKDKVLFLNFKQNVKEVTNVISNDSNLCHLLTYQCSESLKSDHIYWDFVTLCLILLKALSETLLLQENEDLEHASHENDVPKGILSISQENTVKKCIQFIIALGIMPNLIPRMKQVLEKRTAVIKILENLEVESCLKKKYYQVVCCLLILVECLQQKHLKRIILTFHTGDLLTTLLQICYAPIKKIDESKPNSHSYASSKLQVPVAPMEENYEFSNRMLKIKECPISTDEEFIREMLVDRKHFMSVLGQLVEQVDPSVLFWELLLLQGTSLRSDQDSQRGRLKLPVWFQNVCNQIFTEKLMSPCGIKTFVKVCLDKMCDTDVETGIVNKEKIDAIAKLITLNKVKHMPAELYVKHVSNQVLELFHMKGTTMDMIFTCIASSIMLHLIDLNIRLAEYYIFNIIFQPFLLILGTSDEKPMATEEEISHCIEDAHQIFVLNTSILSIEAMKMLLPFYNLLFIMYIRLINGVLFIKIKVEDLLLAILNNSDEDDAVLLLQLTTFPDTAVPLVRSAARMKCVFGDCGGVQIIRNNQPSLDDMLEDNNDKCQALLTLVNKASDKKLKVSYFLSLLKRLTFENNRRHAPIEKEDLSFFFDHVIYLHLLEELSTQLGDDLINDAGKAIELISGILSCSVSDDLYNENVQITEEKLLAVLPILSTIIGYKEQLTYKHWTDMKTCLPSLQKLIASTKETFIKDMAHDISVAIKTHGAIHKCTKSKQTLTDDDHDFAKKISNLMSNQLLSSMNIDNVDTESETPVKNIPRDFFCSSSSHTHEKQFQECSRPKIEEIPCPEERKTLQKQSCYTHALSEANDSCLPTRGHGLLMLCTLVETRDQEALAHQADLLKIFQENLSDEDSYIYLSAIRGISALADINAETVFPVLLSEMEIFNDAKLDLVLKIGEVFLKICQNLGELAVKYRNTLLNIFLKGARHQDSCIRASSLSNLGEVCRRLKFSIGPSLQEVLLCVKSLLKTDPDIMVRRSAVLVLRLLLQGTGKDTFKILKNDIKEVYALLRWTSQLETDDVLKLQCELALEEVNIIVKNTLKKPPRLIKEIRIADC